MQRPSVTSVEGTHVGMQLYVVMCVLSGNVVVADERASLENVEEPGMIFACRSYDSTELWLHLVGTNPADIRTRTTGFAMAHQPPSLVALFVTNQSPSW